MKTVKQVGVKPLSEVAFAADTSWLKMYQHDAAGSTSFAWEGSVKGTAYSGAKAVSGTTDWQSVTNQPTNVTGVNVNWASNGSATGNGTLSYTLATTSLTWAENGDTAGAAVDVSAGGVFTLLSANGESINVTITSASLPGADASDADIAVAATGGSFSAFGEFLSAGDNGTAITSGDLLTVLSEVTRTDIVGTTFIFFRVSRPAVTTSKFLMAFNNPFDGAAPGQGYGLKYLSTGKIQLIYSNFDLSFATTSAMDTSNTDMLVGAYVSTDGTNGITAGLGANGVQQNTGSSTKQESAAPIRSSIFSNINSSNAIVDIMESGTTLSDVFIIRTATEQTAKFSELIAAYNAAPKGDIQWAFDGL